MLFTLFDKSFLQSLSLDESVWFDKFFAPIICPLFYVETLGDLGKAPSTPKEAEAVVKRIAAKFPDMSGTPISEHREMCLGELLGSKIPLGGKQIPISGGYPVKADTGTAVIFKESPEVAAFSKWQRGEFWAVEKIVGSLWRATVSSLDLKTLARTFRSLGIDGKNCKSLREAKSLAKRIVTSRDKPFERMHLALMFLGIGRDYQEAILRRWSVSNYMAIGQYAPYVAHVYTVELFFQIALAANLISADRPSNRIDISYLFYLPFCKIFVSSDKLHRKCAPLFLRKDQEFVWGPDLKLGLREIDAHFQTYSDKDKEQGVFRFAEHPPKEGETLVAKLWDRHMPGWRDKQKTMVPGEKFDDKKMLERLKMMTEAPPLKPEDMEHGTRKPEAMMFERRVRQRKGSWLQLPRDLEAE